MEAQVAELVNKVQELIKWKDMKDAEDLNEGLEEKCRWRDWKIAMDTKMNEHIVKILELQDEVTKSKHDGGGGGDKGKAQRKRLEPEDFKMGDNFEQWGWALGQYLEYCHPGKGRSMLQWAVGQTDVITEESVKQQAYQLDSPMMKDAWTIMYATVKAVEGVNIVRKTSNDGQNAAELYRQLKMHFDPESAITAQALRNQLHRVPRCKKLVDVLPELTKCEVKMARLQAMEPDRPFNDIDRIMMLRDLVPKDIDDELEKNPEMADDYRRLKSYITGMCRRQIERDNRKETSKKKEKGNDEMDVDSLTEKVNDMKREILASMWGQQNEGEDLHAMGKAGWKGGKAGGGKGWPGKGQPWQQPWQGGGGGKGDRKGSSPYAGVKGGKGGKDGGKGGKALPRPTGEFHGTCNWCWEWGHSAKYCKAKDKYMDNIRRQQQAAVDDKKDDGEDSDEDGDEEECEQFCLEDAAKTCRPCGETVAAVQDYMGYRKVEATMDSGSCDSIMANRDGGKIKVKPSKGSLSGKKYTSASGHAISNEGESNVKFMAENGGRRKMKYQRGDTTKTLASVGNVCDNGNCVIMSSKGGHILKDEDGEIYRKAVKMAKTVTPFHRKRGVYVMDMWVKDDEERSGENDDMDVGNVAEEDKWIKVNKNGKPVKPNKKGFTRQDGS